MRIYSGYISTKQNGGLRCFHRYICTMSCRTGAKCVNMTCAIEPSDQSFHHLR
jgi:hypothetical protein